MHYLRRSTLVSLLAIALIAVLAGCEGDRGPAGPQGPKGDPGDPGEPGPGTRTVMTGTVPAQANPFEISIPGFTLDDPALVSVFIDIADVDEWDELPVEYEDGTGQVVVAYASLFETQSNAGVVLYNCPGFDYIIIVIE